MGGMRTAIFVAILLSAASCSVISSQVRKEAEPPVLFKTLVEETVSYIGKTVIVGGYILETKNLADVPAHGDKVKELMTLMVKEQKLFGDTQPLTSDDPKSAAVNLEFFKNPPAHKRKKK